MFTNADKMNIRFYLGYPQLFLGFSNRLESAIRVIQEDADAVLLVQSILEKLGKVSADLDESYINAGLKRVEEIEWYAGKDGNGSTQIIGITAQGRQLVNQLSILFGVPKNADIFGKSGYGTDGWMGYSGNSRFLA